MADIPTPKLFWGNSNKLCLEKRRVSLMVCGSVKLINDISGFCHWFEFFPVMLIWCFERKFAGYKWSALSNRIKGSSRCIAELGCPPVTCTECQWVFKWRHLCLLYVCDSALPGTCLTLALWTVTDWSVHPLLNVVFSRSKLNCYYLQVQCFSIPML